jgi:hypothetical protein
VHRSRTARRGSVLRSLLALAGVVVVGALTAIVWAGSDRPLRGLLSAEEECFASIGFEAELRDYRRGGMAPHVVEGPLVKQLLEIAEGRKPMPATSAQVNAYAPRSVRDATELRGLVP